MRNHMQLLALSVLLLGADRAGATDRHFADIIAYSPNGYYEVQAKSPDNASSKPDRRAFQSNFVYTCIDKKAGKTLWIRKQPMGEPILLDKDSHTEIPSPNEDSPIAIFVSDDGWTVIRTDWDELIAVNNTGRDTCNIKLLATAITKEEYKKYVHETTAGPMWAEHSLWYFLKVNDRQLFVIRPWWGRRLIIDIEKGKLLTEDNAISTAAASHERNYIITELTKGIETRKHWEKNNGCSQPNGGPPLTAAYLAGCLKVREAIPLLRKLENSTYCGQSSSGGLSMLEKFNNEVDPHSYRTLTMCQIAQLSLRRLEEKPGAFSVNQFQIRREVYNGYYSYVPKALLAPRHANIDKVQNGMKAEQVLDLLGGPDFVGDATWEYDMDTVPPISLILKWDVRHVIGIVKKSPPLWKDGLSRDEAIAY